MKHLRAICLSVNETFGRYEEEFGVKLDKINAGAAPGDGTGDTIERGMEKVYKNLLKILDEIEYRESTRNMPSHKQVTPAPYVGGMMEDNETKCVACGGPSYGGHVGDLDVCIDCYVNGDERLIKILEKDDER